MFTQGHEPKINLDQLLFTPAQCHSIPLLSKAPFPMKYQSFELYCLDNISNINNNGS